ncbi:ABC transporter permease [Natronoglycomyces albus]|uniref:ABC transporter permease n=1 Tax=Natronoglycomyces albus TaxID=2811108 RepID=A0A895XQ72_9ACTN|nr:ABC transporter permease [Natronoglycomyces albus]QSB04696.1 ABC transporter permease [Natronoglycomyces albus]
MSNTTTPTTQPAGGGKRVDAEAITSKERTQLQMIMTRFFRHKLAVGSLIVFLIIVAFAFIGPHLWKYDYRVNPDLLPWEPPSAEHPFGTNRAGRDMFGTTMRATGQSLKVAFLVALLSTGLGAIIGAVAGYFRGMIDAVISRFMEIMFVIPFLVITAALAGQIRGGATWFHMALIIGLFGWLGTARVVRAEVLSLREKEFIEAAKSLGATDLRIIFRHLLPNTMSVILVSATLQIAFAILAEATLSFLGLGIQPPDTSLGLLINDARGAPFTERWYLFYVPGIFIIMIALTINFIGDGLRDAMDPRQTMVRR